MIFDNTLLFSSGQAITASAASTNSIDLGATGTPVGGSALTRDIGAGEEIEISVLVTEVFATLTSLTVTIETDDNSSFSSATTRYSSGAIAAATLVAGYQFKVPAHFPLGTNERYVRLYYTVAGSNATTGKITAGVVAARQSNSALGVAV